MEAVVRRLKGVVRRSDDGFSLVEVLVTMLIVGTGLLGFAKLQAAALSNTQISRVRSLVALQASSLASAMYANRSHWFAGPSSFTAAQGRVNDPTGVLSATVSDSCQSGCTPEQLAAYDVQTWAQTLNKQFPSHAAAVNCQQSPPQPVHCTIEVDWQEKDLALGHAGAATPTGRQRYTLHVEP